MMEDKTFELLTKMYNEFSNKIDGMQNKIDGMENKIDGIQNDIKEFKNETNNRLTKIEIIIENEIRPDIKACLAGYQMVYEKQQEQGKQLELINAKLDKHDVEITVLKGGQKRKAR